jgi:hypothetical protein
MGRDVDVPMLLAKLRVYGARTKDLEGQVRRLTNVKVVLTLVFVSVAC